MTDRIYADFTSPLGYLASRRVDRMAADGLLVPDWRAVTHRHGLPQVSLPLSSFGRRNRQSELELVRELLEPGEVLPGQAAGVLPAPDAPVAAYAEAYGAGLAPAVRRLLFEAYWLDGNDIGDPEVLRRLLPPVVARRPHTGDPMHDFGYAASPARTPLTTGAAHRMRDWQREWLALGAPVTLAYVTAEATYVGHGALERLAAATGAELVAS